MSTWHQDRAPVPLWHATKWTVVTGGAGQHTCVARWDTAEEAHRDALNTGGYVLPPDPRSPK
jgi:hypothetical protein